MTRIEVTKFLSKKIAQEAVITKKLLLKYSKNLINIWAGRCPKGSKQREREEEREEERERVRGRGRELKAVRLCTGFAAGLYVLGWAFASPFPRDVSFCPVGQAVHWTCSMYTLK